MSHGAVFSEHGNTLALPGGGCFAITHRVVRGVHFRPSDNMGIRKGQDGHTVKGPLVPKSNFSGTEFYYEKGSSEWPLMFNA